MNMHTIFGIRCSLSIIYKYVHLLKYLLFTLSVDSIAIVGRCNLTPFIIEFRYLRWYNVQWTMAS